MQHFITLMPDLLGLPLLSVFYVLRGLGSVSFIIATLRERHKPPATSLNAQQPFQDTNNKDNIAG